MHGRDSYRMSTDFTFWLILSMLICLVVTSVVILIRACISSKCDALQDCLLGQRGRRAEQTITSLQNDNRRPVLYIVSPHVVVESGHEVRRIDQPDATGYPQEAPPIDGLGYTALLTTPPPAYEPPPGYTTPVHLKKGNIRRSASCASVSSATSAWRHAVRNNLPSSSTSQWI
ncbi:uncharacterized protein LOC129581854 [Paramacrobiotus metropolitanus]|uniref:uncharacterized protein LOC129581854 n=1 Tax=Paramacrobiotus metropolitanus TaxID=2943436 RepID=UPI0024463FAE|nr:uncharacterized protein LOC129581854 [Paramacrobiotus metropolitanus]